MAVGIALAAAVLLGFGFVLQQAAARRVPMVDTLSWRLFRDLIDQPRWLAGVAAMVAGQILGAVALGKASITVVEPLLTTNMLFALGLARVLSEQSLRRREWLGAVALAAGVAVFVIAARPHSGSAGGPVRQWLFVAAVVLVGAVAVGIVRRRTGGPRAIGLATAAGLLFGLQDGFTRRTMLRLGHGLVSALSGWPPYAVVSVAVVGLLLAQSAFEAAPLRMSLPVITVAEPAIGIGYGIVVLGDVTRTGTVWWGLQIGAVVVAIAGCVLVTRSSVLLAPSSGPDAT